MQTSAIILIGGQSKRMGRDKALLPMPGQPQQSFIAHLASLLSATCADVLLVARDQEQAERHSTLPNVRVITDELTRQGPLMGLYSGLQAARYDHALVTAVDMPFLQPALIAFLFSQPLDEHLLIPVVDDIPQVLLAVYPRTVLPIISQCLAAGRRDPRRLLKLAPVRYISEGALRQADPHLRSFLNVNTPEDLASVQ